MKFNTNNTMKALTTFSFLFVSLMSMSQSGENLVANPSFESTEKKPKKLGSIAYATGWTAATGVRPDLFVSSNNPDIDVPLNIMGSEIPKEGNNYAGIITYSYGGKMNRTYLVQKLEAPMKKGMKYCVKFNVSLAEASKFASNNMGALFSKKPKMTDAKVSIIEEPSIVHFNNEMNVITARYNWTEICGVYTSKGGEKFISLGNFFSDKDTKSEKMKIDKKVRVKQIIAAYYYVDDISVVLIDEDKGEKCDCAAEEAGESYSTTIYQTVFNITDEMTPKEKIEEHQVFFAFGRDKMNSQGEESLKFIAETMKANPEMKLQIFGHNNAMEDEVGVENDYYADMDSKRVAAVMKYLIDQGIYESRLMVSQKGSESPNPTASESDDEDLRMAKSRRVTFKVR